MTTQLFIEDYEIELNKAVEFSITKQFTNLSNPTDIINDWSKTVSIPATDANNKIFSYLFRNDNVLNSSAVINPYKKLNFRLVVNSDVVMIGYCKVNSITQASGLSTYNINLYGKLGEVLSELQNISIVKPYDESEQQYFIGDIFKTVINKELIETCWTQQPDLTKSLDEAAVKDIIGFACTNSGFNNTFDSASYQLADNKTCAFTDKEEAWDDKEGTLTEKYEDKGYSIDSVLGDGLLPRQWGEYRSYYQVPYIYVSRLFEILKNKCYELTGYTMKLDELWFNTQNPYWGKLVMMMNRLSVEDKQYINEYYLGGETASIGNFLLCDIVKTKTIDDQTYTSSETVTIADYDTDTFDTTGYSTNSVTYNGELIFTATTEASTWQVREIGFGKQNGIELDAYVGNTLAKKILIAQKNNALKTSGYDEVITEDNTNTNYWTAEIDGTTLKLIVHLNEAIPTNSITDQTIRFKASNIINSDNQITILYFAQVGDDIWVVPKHTTISNYHNEGLNTLNITLNESVRTGKSITLSDMWDNTYSLFDVCVNYTKTFHLLWDVDNLNKTIIIEPLDTYFKNYTITDWTKKVDFTKDYEITPLIYDKKYYNFDYEDNEGKFSEKYLSKYGVNYGGLKVKTSYAFNNDDEDIFENLQSSVISTENILDFTKIEALDFVYTASNEVMPCEVSTDNAPIDTFGQYFIFNGFSDFNTDMIDCYITDDTPYQQQNNQYMYIENVTYGQNNGYSIPISTYPSLSILDNSDNLCLFNVPNENYCTNITFNDAKSIYVNVWKNFAEGELYNRNTHKLTCYILLKPDEFKQFSHKNFVIVNNVLYLVNKISDYSMTNSLVKCELIKINDVKNYTELDFMKTIDKLTLKGLSLTYVNGSVHTDSTLGSFISSSDVTFDNGLKTITYDEAGITLTIDGTTIKYSTTKYVDPVDLYVDVTLVNTHTSATFKICRYAEYPYPQLTCSISEITDPEQTFYLYWTYSDTDDITPTVTFEYSTEPYGMLTFDSENVETADCKWDEPNGDEYFRTKWTLPIVATHFAGEQLTAYIKVTDATGSYGTISLTINC